MINKTLTQNAIFSIINGLIMLAFSQSVASILFNVQIIIYDLSAPTVILITAAVLISFAIVILAYVKKLFTLSIMVLLITIADVSWVIGVLFVILFANILSLFGIVYFLYTAIVVGYFAFKQYQYIKGKKD